MKNILITGGLGFIGSHLADSLSANYNVTIIDKLSKRVHPYKKFIYKPKNCKIIIGDLNDRKLLLKVLKKFHYIYHFASHQDHQKDYNNFIKDNLNTTSLIFEILKESKKINLKQFILASSQSIYGEGYYKFGNKIYLGKRDKNSLKNKKWFIKNESERFINHKETDIPNPINFYGLSKLFQEQVVKQCSQELDINYTILRYSIVQGARQSFFNTYSGLCRNLISSYMKLHRPVIFEDGMSTRDFVNIDDVTKANKKILNNKSAFNQIFNIGGGKKNTLIEFDKIVRTKLKTELKPIINKYFRENDPRDTISDISKAKKLLGWRPHKNIINSIESYIEWVLKNKEALNLSKNEFKNMKKNGSVIDCH